MTRTQLVALALLALAVVLPALAADTPAPQLGHAPDHVAAVKVGTKPFDHVPSVDPGDMRVTAQSAGRPRSATVPYPTDELLDALARCESNMRQDAYNPAGPYLSYFQWLQGTWWSVGGEGDPRDHPYEVQRELARTLILQAGWSQFPVCSRSIGAR